MIPVKSPMLNISSLNSWKMKCSRFRKRYVAIGYRNEDRVRRLSYELMKTFDSRQKFSNEHIIIILTDQFTKEQICNYVSKRSIDFKILGVSGTIKGCKNQSRQSGEKQVHIS